MSKRRKPAKSKPRPPTEAGDSEPVEPRGRPGRRTAEDRTEAVLDLLAGKASVEQLSRRYGVQPQTVEKWREAALAGMAQSMRQGNSSTARERELEKELKALEKAFTRLAIRNEIAERELRKNRPTRPGR